MVSGTADNRNRLASRALPRWQKRWAGRLRTGGALGLLLGAVALVDSLLALRRADAPMATAGAIDVHAPPWAAVLVIALGAVAFWIGRRWGAR